VAAAILLQCKEKKSRGKCRGKENYFIVETIKWLNEPFSISPPPLSTRAGNGFVQQGCFSQEIFVVLLSLIKNAMNVTVRATKANSSIGLAFITGGFGCMRI